MSVIITLPREDILKEYFSNLAEEEMGYFKYISDIIIKKVILPIIEADDKESAIETEVIHYLLYSLNLYPIMQRIIKHYDNYFEFLRKEVKKRVVDDSILNSMLYALDILKVHISFFSELFSRDPYRLSLFGVDEVEAYFYTLTKTSLAFNTIFVAMYEKVEALQSLSQIVERYAEEFQPFVSSLQVLSEEESTLSEKTFECDE
ncbi:MAG: hypothetical protein L6N96_05225 [Candidatus Methylarchaceae archaeon HK02M2]|nr:hypothetical protein [Candidatus Methylarchaceae archaeon HK02M2]